MEAQQRISSREYAEWIAYNNISPIGDERAELSRAIIANTVAACHGNKSKLADFMPRWDVKPMTKAEFIERLKACGVDKYGSNQ